MQVHQITVRLKDVAAFLTNADGTVSPERAAVLHNVKVCLKELESGVVGENLSLQGVCKEQQRLAENQRRRADLLEQQLIEARGQHAEQVSRLARRVRELSSHQRSDPLERVVQALPSGTRLTIQLPGSLRVVGSQGDEADEDEEDLDE